MSTQRKNTILAIVQSGKKEGNTSLRTFRCSDELWENFSILCNLSKRDKTAVIVSNIAELVEDNYMKIIAEKRRLENNTL
jgi:predicted transcriptional regulator